MIESATDDCWTLMTETVRQIPKTVGSQPTAQNNHLCHQDGQVVKALDSRSNRHKSAVVWAMLSVRLLYAYISPCCKGWGMPMGPTVHLSLSTQTHMLKGENQLPQMSSDLSQSWYILVPHKIC